MQPSLCTAKKTDTQSSKLVDILACFPAILCCHSLMLLSNNGTDWIPQHRLSHTVIPVPQDVNKEPGAEELFKKIGEAYEVSSRRHLVYDSQAERDCNLTFTRNQPCDCGLATGVTLTAAVHSCSLAVAWFLQAMCKRITISFWGHQNTSGKMSQACLASCD